jgi:hypothetical protein
MLKGFNLFFKEKSKNEPESVPVGLEKAPAF